MHALVLVWSTPFGDFGFGNGNTHADYIYNPHPFYTSKKIFTLQKNSRYMFDNIYGTDNSNGHEEGFIATGHYVGDSHYVVVLQDSKGELLDLNVTELGLE